MGNAIGVKKAAKIMKIDGQTFKIKTPATAMHVLKDYSAAHVLLDSEQVKKFGIRAQELRPDEGLKPGKIYFLVEMPRFPEPGPRRAKSLPCKTRAKERLEELMLRQKSAMDMSSGSGSGPLRVKMRLPRAEIEKLMRENKDEADIGQRILQLCLKISNHGED